MADSEDVVLPMIDVEKQCGPSFFSELPIALQPIYRTPKANSPVLLHAGEIRIQSGETQHLCNGTLQYVWLPDSRIRFDLPSNGLESIGLISASKGIQTLTLRGCNPTGCLVLNVSERIGGIINEPLIIGDGTRASKLYFHLVNCAHIQGAFIAQSEKTIVAGRIQLQADGWFVLIDPVAEIRTLHEELKQSGGYAITHIGCLERVDKTPFELSNSDEILEALTHLLSFAHGYWVPTILRVAHDANGIRIRESWSDQISSPYNQHMSWFSDRHATILPEIFPLFLVRWQRPIWKEAIRRTIWWYVASNERSGGLDGAIILLQVALELLAWIVYVEDGQLVSKDGFEKLPGADKLRLLVSWIGLPLGVPSEFPELQTFARQNKWALGPWVFTEVRNALVHPKNRNKLNNSAPLYDVWRLGMWYLETALLRACDYRGNYANRLRMRWAGEVEQVPWV